jgi:hypothetical protein
MPLKQKEAPPARLATWQPVRMETRSLVPMAMGAHGGVKADAAFFDARVATAADKPLPQQPDEAPDQSVTLQAAALRAQAPAAPRPPVTSQSPPVDRTQPADPSPLTPPNSNQRCAYRVP